MGAIALIKFLVVLYRISALHPLAKVPGPTIAAATWWYRTYHEVWPHSGGMRNELDRLHDIYGKDPRFSVALSARTESIHRAGGPYKPE